MPNPQNVPPRWEKGVSGNPKGRPPKTATAFMREFGDADLIDVSIRIRRSNGEEVIKRIDAETMKDKKGRTVTLNKVLAATMWQQAIAGDLASQKELLNRMEGAVGKESPEQENNESTDAETIKAMVSSTYGGALPPAESKLVDE